MPSDDPTAAIEALLETCKPALTFRHLSAHLQVPTRHAQKLLHSYLTSHSSHTLSALWCVTTVSAEGVKRTSLSSTAPSPKNPRSATLWALAAADIPANTPASVWLSADISREHALQAAPTSEANSLRDGRYNPIRSPTSVWRPAENAPVTSAKKASVVNSRPTSSLLASAKAKVKARGAKRNATKKTSAFAAAPGSSMSKGNSLFSTKRLGADATARIKAEDRKNLSTKPKQQSNTPSKRNGKTTGTGKKSRRVIADSDDDENEKAPSLDDDDEPDEEQRRVDEMEREAAEREAAEAERAAAQAVDAERAEAERAEAQRLELQREVAELTGQVEDVAEDSEGRNGDGSAEDEEPQSPDLRDLGEGKGGDQGTEGGEPSPKRTPDSGKRKLSEAFGLPAIERSGGRRVRREVEETVEDERGYLVTRRIYKTFDEDGNEVVDEKPKPQEQKPASPVQNLSEKKPLKPANSLLKSAKKDKTKDVKRPSSKLGNSNAKKSAKKTKGKNIMSYFGKK